MYIRKARRNDCEMLFIWRNDPLAREMFINNENINFEEHLSWFENSLLNPNRHIYIGELENKMFGVCRFDLDQKTNVSDISININPVFRGKGLSQNFLLEAIDLYELEIESTLNANIKRENIPSQIIFKKAGFLNIYQDEKIMKFEKLFHEISYKKVDSGLSEELYKLLQTRKFSISHKNLPSFNEHKKFVKSIPYKDWYLIYQNSVAIGTFYIQNDNSIGLNLNNPSLRIVKNISKYIRTNFDPNPPEPSKVAPYFFINIAESNKRMLNILKVIGCEPLQVSFRLNDN
ncbi:GNAT family N-acetyltransferase [Prochlorococcus marinus]|uniref:GNAT family N-acetyltransferase n=1 Tax=Prochlorococcus marinus TaxID=1219 RepID=UPI001AD9CFC2|nr:GNAT family N-acetyltransferase [Prochlorococcus marinus]MBO8217655.1 GNAT family N-acetyltransferase [Prochlorococcus marinus XMU1405]MBW3040817.1 hypothetical protein [Prochlorococcus marinus str. MU1405]MBW3048276.1 hypothetical protein [Prochlorococcus marinus str. MU1406]